MWSSASEQVLDGITGRLTPRGDHLAFADALVELARDAEKRQRFGTAGAAHVREHFSLEAMIESYRRLCSADAPVRRPRMEPPFHRPARATQTRENLAQ